MSTSRVAAPMDTLTYWGFWLVALAAIALLVLRRTTASKRLTMADRATAAGLLSMALIVNLFFLRANLTQRFADAVVPVALLLAWSIGEASAIGSIHTRRLTTAVSVLLLVVLTAATVVWSGTARRLEDAGLRNSWHMTTARFDEVRTRLRGLPPAGWSTVEMGGTLPVARYIARCTKLGDHLLVAGYTLEVYVLARRRFAAGQGTVSPGFYTSDEDQRRAVSRLAAQSVPIVLAEAEKFEEGCVSDYPLLARDILNRYRDAGTIEFKGKTGFRVFVESIRQPTGVDPELGLP